MCVASSVRFHFITSYKLVCVKPFTIVLLYLCRNFWRWDMFTVIIKIAIKALSLSLSLSLCFLFCLSFSLPFSQLVYLPSICIFLSSWYSDTRIYSLPLVPLNWFLDNWGCFVLSFHWHRKFFSTFITLWVINVLRKLQTNANCLKEKADEKIFFMRI